MKSHNYNIKIEWNGNLGVGTKNYKSYKRNHRIFADKKSHEIHASSDLSFLGDATKYNPEELFLSSISACHMLWYLHLCSSHKIIVTEYIDYATGIMKEAVDGSGKFVKVTLNPSIVITSSDKIESAYSLHESANKMCFIANSCNFEIEHNPNIIIVE